MSDDLDDLFGAIDGGDVDDNAKDVKANDQEQIEEKGEQVNNVEERSKRSKLDNENMDNDDNENDKTRTNNVNYTNIMSMSSTITKPKEDEPMKNKYNSHDNNDKQQDEASTPKEISTGTSHDKSVRSYSAYPKNYEKPKPDNANHDNSSSLPAAKTYPFTLDPFQQQAVNYIHHNESVLVAAHTSAGKTAVAEYAVAQSLKAGQRVVYTSPIKALSNQKFRDLQQEFSDVGLMTGDITINPTATALVMTTEILRSMLYRGSEIMREVAWVIYDEVHYMRDVERGVVWEESIILLPHRVRFVFLSATIPNATQFADWIAHVHHQPCHVVYTNYRPVPLQHYVFPSGGDGLHLVVDERGKFREANFQKAIAMLQGGTSTSVDAASAEAMLSSGNAKKRKRSMGGSGGQKRGANSPTNDLHRIVKLIMMRNLNPVIIFSFSKKDCEKYALGLTKEDYTDEVEKDLITQVYTNAIDSLGTDDQQLPQVLALLPLLKRGIGIHHGGLLPILKEIVEILFSEGLIKALFATETFSIGINMPAKTVVFTNTRKWDGKDFRWVTSGEYIQMSGRAGRRGKDDRGIVIQMLDEKMEPSVCKGILYGDPDPLNSSYKIKYNMLLNMMRVEDVDPEYLLRASFHQYQKEKDAPALIQQANEYEQKASETTIELIDNDDNDDTDHAHADGSGKTQQPQQLEQIVSEYYHMNQQLQTTKYKLKQLVRQPQYVMKFLLNTNNVGRFLDVVIDDEHYGWGILVKCQHKPGTQTSGEAGRAAAAASKDDDNQDSISSDYTLDVLLMCVDRHFDNTNDNTKSQQEDMENSNLLWRGSVRHCRPIKPQNNEKGDTSMEENETDDSKLASMRVFTIELQHIEGISAVKVFVPQDVQRIEARRNLSVTLKEVQKRFPQGIPLLDPMQDLKITDPNLTTFMDRAKALKERMDQHALCTTYYPDNESQRTQLVHLYETKVNYLQRAKALKDEARACETIALKDDLKKMKRVLKKLGHVDVQGVIQTKGRCACEINTANELVVVELIFTGVFNDLSVEQCVALLSCMTYDERNKDDGDDPTKGMKSYLANPFLKLQEVARTVAKAEIACKIEVDEDEFVDKFNPGMMEAVFAWCKGAKFVEVQKLTGSFEGTTIRTLRRLEELNRQIVSAAKSIGNHELQAKFEKGSDLLKRDIVFCSSLYL